jgi:hypothetical protein
MEDYSFRDIIAWQKAHDLYLLFMTSARIFLNGKDMGYGLNLLVLLFLFLQTLLKVIRNWARLTNCGS